MNILVVHEVSYVEKPVYEYQDFAERLVSKGHNVVVIDFNESKKNNFMMNVVTKTNKAYVNLYSLANNGIPILKYIVAKMNYKKKLKEI